MKVFITWSGDRSRAVAEVIRKWLPGVLQAVKPYFSPDDVAKGSRWFPEVAKELEASSVGLLCVTRENLTAPWLLFEAGALGKNLDKSKVCPLLFGVEPTDLTGPLSQFQGARFQKDEFKRVVQMVNAEIGDGSLATDVLGSVFEMWWPKLEEGVNKGLAGSGSVQKGDEIREDRDILLEILRLSRSMAQTPRSRHIVSTPPQVVDDLVTLYIETVQQCSLIPVPQELSSAVRDLMRPIEYIARRGPSRRAVVKLLSATSHQPLFRVEREEDEKGVTDEDIPF